MYVLVTNVDSSVMPYGLGFFGCIQSRLQTGMAWKKFISRDLTCACLAGHTGLERLVHPRLVSPELWLADC